MWWLALAGCGLFDKTKSSLDDVGDQIAGATEATVLQGSILGVQPPQDPDLAALLDGTDFAPGTSAIAYVADATTAADMESGLVAGASVDVEGVAMTEDTADSDGLYLLDPEDGPAYEVGADWTITVERGDGPRTAAIALPAPAEGVLDTSDGSVVQRAGTPLVVDLTGRGFNSALIVVMGPDGPTFTNEPQSVEDLYELSQSDDAGSTTIPGTAFSSPGLYAVGVAGLSNDKAEDFDGFNTILSKVRAGEMVFVPLTATP